MRLIVLVTLITFATGCRKTDLVPLPTITRAEITHTRYGPWKDMSQPSNVSSLLKFIEGHRQGWTRTYGVGFGAPAPFVGVRLYDERRYIGEFTVRSGVLRGGHAVFEVTHGNVRAHKRVPKSEANRFLDLIGIGHQWGRELE